ncbi:MAG TPA: diguanylate cyclase [Gaiellales bacterium]|jgi:diguanylate cyclase (GGDEF)-like protein/putative nucleotidyltransferase with HDIG domain|nr:diguanylate cyclase [Gaiellales bacterium]
MSDRRRGRVSGIAQLAGGLLGGLALRRPWSQARLVRILDLFEEHVYAGEVMPDGRYVHHASGQSVGSLLGGPVPEGIEIGDYWESRIVPDDREAYDAFNRRLLDGEDAEVTYRIVGADGLPRVFRDRARPRRKADGGVWIDGILSDVTLREDAAAQLAEANGRFTSLLDVVGAHVYLALAHPDGSLEELFQGPGGDRLLGGAEPDPEMVNWDAAVHPEDKTAYDEFNSALGRGRESEVFYRLIGADGVTRWVHDRAAVRPLPNGSYEVSGIVSDVTDRRRLEDDLRRSVEAMQVTHRDLERARADAELRAATDDLTGTFNRRHFLQIAGDWLESEPARCGFLLLDADHFKQINDAHGHVVGDAVLVQLAQRLQSALDPRDCLARWGGEEFAVFLRDCSSEQELVQRAERLRSAVCGAPIVDSPVPLWLTISIGACLASAHADIDALLDQADRCLYAAKHQGRNRASLRPGVAPAHETDGEHPEALEIARALAFTAALRGGITEAHAEQVATLAALTAERLDLCPSQILRCRLAGWLHDIGKLAVPEQTLTKPAPLTAAEWAVVRTHPELGAAAVRRIDALAEVAPAIRHHHERYDGEGYPDGLSGTRIPIEARVVAAADAYAAMTTDRAYSAAQTPGEAALELRAQAGSHLDPAVVDALLAALGLAGDVSDLAA